jgi:hypothetical protein
MIDEQDALGPGVQAGARARKSTAGMSARRSSAMIRATSASEPAWTASMVRAAAAEPATLTW